MITLVISKNSTLYPLAITFDSDKIGEARLKATQVSSELGIEVLTVNCPRLRVVGFDGLLSPSAKIL